MASRNPELDDYDRTSESSRPAQVLIAVAERTALRLREAGDGFVELERLAALLDTSGLPESTVKLIVELRIGCARTSTDITHLLMLSEVCKALAHQELERKRQ